MKPRIVHSQIMQAMQAQDELLRQTAPALWWARLHHLNSRAEHMDFTDVPYLVAMYSMIRDAPLLCVEKSVQCGLSELFIVNSHIEASNGLTVMYVLPKYELRNRFVNNRVYKVHKKAPKYAELVKSGSGGGIHRTSMIHFGSGTLVYVGSNVESEFIEIPVDSAYVDEKDRCNLANLELLPDRYTASPYKYHREISNPTIEGFGIDERFQESMQSLWYVKCPHCGYWFTPDFFAHIVRQVGPRSYLPRDPLYDPDDEKKEIALICNKCNRAVDRLMPGEFVSKYPKRSWQGVRISKLFNKFASMRELYDKWVKAQGNVTKTQVVYNSDLGLPFTSKGAKITRVDLIGLEREYALPTSPEAAGKHVRVMGVDVGADIHYVVRDLVKEDGVPVRRLIDVGSVPTFELLCTEVIDKWKPRMTVIDAYPEIHKVMDLKAKYPRIHSSKFQKDQRKLAINKKDRELSIDRTALLDYMKSSVTNQQIINPRGSEFLAHGEYFSHMLASTRVLEADDENPDKNRFVWKHTRDDHLFLAESYCYQAYVLLPNIDDVMEFFMENTTPEKAMLVKDLKDVSDEERDRLAELSRMTPDAVLMNIRNGSYKGK